MQDRILEIRNISKKYHNANKEIKAIENLSFEIYKDEILAIVGPSGCGKSTLLSIISGLEEQSEGQITINDNCQIGYMLQTDCLFPWLTIFENTLIGLEITKQKNKENIQKVENLLKKYGLEEFKNQYPDNLSGGMRQRVALIRTLATNPDLILLDEPCSALDYQTKLILSDDLYKIIKKEQKTAIIITHDIAEAISMADRIIVLTKRPCTIKNIYQVKLDRKSTPIENRKDSQFNNYFDLIWRDLDAHF